TLFILLSSEIPARARALPEPTGPLAHFSLETWVVLLTIRSCGIVNRLSVHFGLLPEKVVPMLFRLMFCGVVGCVWMATLRATGGEPSARLEIDEATRTRCVNVLRSGLGSDEFWPSMHAAEGLTSAGQGQDVRRALAPKLTTETDDQKRCGLARELVRAGE